MKTNLSSKENLNWTLETLIFSVFSILATSSEFFDHSVSPVHDKCCLLAALSDYSEENNNNIWGKNLFPIVLFK